MPKIIFFGGFDEEVLRGPGCGTNQSAVAVKVAF
jgi:hypothetical protein